MLLNAFLDRIQFALSNNTSYFHKHTKHHSSNSMSNTTDRNVNNVSAAVQLQSTQRNPLRRPVGGRRYQRRAFTSRGGKRIVPFFEADFVLRNRFRITEVIDSGGFGQIFSTIDMKTGHNFALKACEAVEDGNRLIIEQKVMQTLNGSQHSPFMVCSGSLDIPTYKNPIHYILMELLGKSLTTLRKECHPWRRFSVGTALRVGEQCIDALEVIHKIGYLHRDIKPSNLCIGLNNLGLQKRVYVIDFGMARKYIQADGELRSERSKAAFRGTTRYVSLTIHERREAGPVDDLWALYYTIIELGEGTLPWRLTHKPKEVEKAKRNCRFTDLCNKFPAHLYRFEKYLRTLSWSDTPDYRYLKSILRECWPSGLTSETFFEWEMPKQSRMDNQYG